MFSPRENFDSIYYSLVTVFILVMGQDWHIISNIYIRASREESKISQYIAQIYFFVAIVLGHIVLLSLFTALLLRNFQSNLKKQVDTKKEKNRGELIKKFSKSAVS